MNSHEGGILSSGGELFLTWQIPEEDTTIRVIEAPF